MVDVAGIGAAVSPQNNTYELFQSPTAGPRPPTLDTNGYVAVDHNQQMYAVPLMADVENPVPLGTEEDGTAA